MADQTPNDGAVPEIQNKVPKPPGVSAKHRQTVIMLAVGGLIALVIALSNSPSTPKTKAKTAKPSAAENPTSPQSVQQYVRQLDEEAKNLAQERARAEQMRGETLRMQSMQPGATAVGSVAVQPTPRQLTPEESEAITRRKREQDALRASNVALSFRKDQQPSTGGNRSVSSDLADVRQLIDAQRVALAATMQPPPMPAKPSAASTQEESDRPAPREKKAEDPALQKATGNVHRLFEGSIIETVLTNRLNGSFAGPVNVLVTTPVYSHDGEHVLIPQGARILGETQRVAATGQQRLAVVFHRLIMPDGYAVSLDQFKGLNQIGETGLKDQVNQHYLQTFGASLALGAIAAIEQAGGSYGYNTSGVDVYRQGVSQSLSGSATRILDRFLNVLPTITIREGHRIKVYLTGDLMLPAYENHRMPGDL